jgi:ABC-2 type transport system permease protein
VRAGSPGAVLAFLWLRSTRNAIATKLARLKEPRYLLGALMALAWLGSIVVRRARFGTTRGGALRTSDVLQLVAPAGSFALALVVFLWWLLGRGRDALPLSEAEVQFLFPAPLPHAAILHFAVLKSLAKTVLASVLIRFFAGGPFAPGAARGAVALFLLLATLQLHVQGLAFRRAAWREGATRGGALFGPLSRALALAALAGLVVLGTAAIRDAAEAMRGGAVAGLGEVGEAVARSFGASALHLLLVPFRAVVAPLFARDGAGFFRALPAAALLLVLHHFWVVRAQVRYEDATVEAASRRARERETRRRGRGALPSDRRRGAVPFRLRAVGAPEVALLWKGLLAETRLSLSTVGAAAGLVCLAVFGLGRLAVSRWPEIAPTLAALVPAIGGIGLLLAVLVLPVGLRLDFRRDLTNAAAMKLWPIAPARLAAGELAAPLLVSTRAAWIALAAALALSAGVGAPPRLPLSSQLALALAAAILAPAAASIVLVVQNALTLAFPMWFPPGERRERGFEASASRLIGFLATLVLFALGALPGSLLAGLAVAAGRSLLGFWVAPIAAVLAALPLAAEAAAGVFLLGTLFTRFDQSRDLETS